MILQKIVDRKREEIARLKKEGIVLPGEFSEAAIDSPRGFRRALMEYEGVSVIAEVKKASPSKGVISPDFDPAAIARNYQKNGAQAVSVLTDVDFFQGSLNDLMQVRSTINLPVLRKDFIIDPLQIEEASLHGADAILLIAAILTTSQIAEYRLQARALGMDSMVEVHDEEDLHKALDAQPDLIGINNRNLNDFSVDIGTTFRLQKMIPDDIPVVSESGLKTSEDLASLRQHRICAALIGESLMRAGHQSGFLGSLRD